jgi:N-formylglutamate deformylase
LTCFDIHNPNPTSPVVLNIPHACDFIAPEYRSDFVLDDAALAKEQAAIVDWFTDELYSPFVEAGGCALVAQFSRLLVDPERFADDSKEVMSERGIGVLYERTTQLKLLRHKPTAERRRELLQRYYEPYHARLTALVSQTIERFGHCILFDCHSFPEHVLPYELSSLQERPDICLGTDAHHSPDALVQKLEAVTARFGWSCARNTPFAGMVVPLDFYGDSRVTGAMLEVNRKLYMDEKTTQRSAGFERVTQWVRELAQVFV